MLYISGNTFQTKTVSFFFVCFFKYSTYHHKYPTKFTRYADDIIIQLLCFFMDIV